MQHSAPKILLVTRNFPPLMGGMERFLHHVYLELSSSFRMAVVGPTGCEDYLRPDSTALTCPTLPPARFLTHCQWQTYLLARRFRPDLVISGSGVTAPAAKFAGLRFQIPIMCFLYGLDIVAPNPLYRWAFLPAIRACTNFVVISQNTKRLAVDAGIHPSRMHMLHPGVTIPAVHDANQGKSFRDRIGAGSRPILLSVGRLTRRKGIVEFIDRALPQIVNECPEVLFVIVGHESSQALSGAFGITHQIEELARTRRLTGNIAMLGMVDDETLWEAYAASQVFVFPVIEQSGDVEGFGMVAVEAAAHGLATVAFATGGVVDAVQDGVSGYLAAPEDYREFARLVLARLKSPHPQVTTQTCIDFAKQFSWDLFGARLSDICATVVSQSKTQRPGGQETQNKAP